MKAKIPHLELVIRTEIGRDGLSELSSGVSTTSGLEGLPVEGVVPDLQEKVKFRI